MPRIYVAKKSVAVVFNGITFRRYPKSNQWAHRMYYTPHAGHRRRGVGALHQEIWKAANGPIPVGCHIHHRDDDPLNNDIGNLECITKDEHDARHRAERKRRMMTPKGKKQFRAALKAAAKWHGSKEGKAWHSQHAKEAWANAEKGTAVCVRCGVKFETWIPGRAKFCTPACRQRAYTADGRYTGRDRKR